MQWDGLIPVIGGIYGVLMAYRIIPKEPKDPERYDLWHRKFGKMMKILSPVLILFGIMELLGIMN